MKKFLETLLWAHSLASETEAQCKAMWKLFWIAWMSGILLMGTVFLAALGKLDTWTCLGFTFLIVFYIWFFWFEIGFQSYKARNYILGQVNTMIQGMVAMERGGVDKEKEEKRVVH